MDYIKTLTPWPFVPALITVVGLCLALFQLRKLVQSIHAQTYQRIYELMIDIDRFFIDNPKLKNCIYPDLPNKTTGRAADSPNECDEAASPRGIKVDEIDEQTEVDGKNLYSVAEMIIDYFDNVYHQRKCMPRGTFGPFSHFMRKAFQDSPLLQQFVRESGEWYPPKFRRHLAGRRTRRERLADRVEGLKARVRREGRDGVQG